ncbi:MAG: chitobiase/beta-hexosaminidase C-terminal domain-containing protein [Candidatus Cloacimonetes bacterium]|nr:chitobiase/beta-hexosaminidase C-terminal domain-containing protein [Candidatus Cloacimonadota bacterium]
MRNYQDATIYYSIDNGASYNEYTFGLVGFPVNENTSVMAYASKANWLNSPVVTSAYNFKVPNPVFVPLSGSFDLPFNASISVISGDPIYYTLDGSIPTIANPTAILYDGTTIPVGYGYTHIRAMAHRANWDSSEVVEVIYNVNGQLQNLVFSLAAGLYYEPQMVTISANPSNAKIYFTTDGTEPDESSALYAAAINITEITTLKAKAYLTSWVASNVASAGYDLKVKAITSDHVPTAYTSAQDIVLQTATPGTIIYYTTDGSVTDFGSSVYAGAIEVASTTRIRAIAYKNDGLDWLPSDLFDQTYGISQQVATPVFNLPGGVYTYAPVTVAITSLTVGATVSYSYDGTNWLLYDTPLQVNNTKVIYAKAVKTDWVPSPVVYAQYIIAIPTVATPVFTDLANVYSLPGTYNNAVDVEIVTSTPGAEIYYTLNGIDPTELDTHYTTPFTISATTTVKAKAFKAPMYASVVLTGEYRIEPLTVLNPIVVPEDDSNPFYEPFYVFMYPRTTDSVIRYTTNGNEPTAGDEQYINPFMLNASTVIKAKAFKDGFASGTVTRNYLITGKVSIDGVTITPPAGNYTTLMTVSTVGALNPADAVLRYTTDGTNPSINSPLFNALNPPLGSSLNLKLRGFKENWLPSDVISASYTFTGQVVLAADLFSLDTAPIYTNAQIVTLNTVTTPVGATLRYTLDGSAPTNLSPAYMAGQQIHIQSTTTINVKGFLNGWDDSIVRTATYTITGQVLLGTMLPESAIHQNTLAVSLGATIPNDALVYYTTDGIDPTPASTLYNNAAFNIDANDMINGSADVTVKVKGYKANWDDSVVLSRTYTFQAGSPIFSTPAGSYLTSRNLELSSTTAGAVIRYTTDGTDPTPVSPAYSIPLFISSSQTVKAIAYNGEYLPSPIASATYVIGTNQLVALPTFTPSAGTYPTAQNVQILCDTPGATIYYRTDGLDPTDSDMPFTADINIPLNSTLTIKARAYKAGLITSQVATATYVITNKVAVVTFTPAAGTYTSAQQVVLATATAGAYIEYSINGGAVSLYTIPITIPVNSTMTISAQAFKDDWIASDIETAVYTITNATAFNQPMLVPAPGTFTDAQSVTIAAPIPATAQVWYTLDGSDPADPANPNRFLYAGAFMMDGNANLNVVAIAAGWENQVFANNIYTFNAQIPAYTPTPGYYPNPTDVSINSGTSGATIYYTMNGDIPTVASSVYGAPITINGDTTFKAFAWKAGYNPSPIVTGIYGIGGIPIPSVAIPVFAPVAGTYASAQTVSISSTTPGAMIRYTLNGDIPSETVGELYIAPIQLPLDSYTMIRAIAYMADASYTSSPVVTSEYTITGQIADVVFTPPAGTYSSPQTVYLSCETLGVYFRYTLDGSEPDNNSPLYNSTGIYVAQNSSVVIKAKAYRSGWTTSLTGTAAYNVRGISFSLSPAAGTYNNAQSVSVISLNPANADVVYSIDGSVPSIPYIGGINLNGGITDDGIRTLRVKATLDTWATTEVTKDYIFSTTSPAFNPPAGTYDSARLVTLSSATSDAVIKYTTNGETPSATVGMVYVAPIAVAENMTLRAYAYKPGYISSNVVSGTYAIGTITPVVVNPVFNPGTTSSTTPLSVTISTTTANAAIYYTTNGDDPSLLSTMYTQAIAIPYNSNVFIKAIAYRENWMPSAIVSANYVVTGTVVNVSFDPIGGTYESAQNVQLSTTTEGAVIRYTTDGTEPNNTSSPLYMAAIPVPFNSNGLVITAKAFRNGWVASQPIAHTYNVTGQVVINEQVFSPAAGSYTAVPSIVLGTTNPAGATIRYTTDGSDPTPTSNVYSPGSIVLPMGATTTVKVRAYLADWTPSVVYTAVYTVTGQVVLAADMFDPASGTYQTPQVVHLLETTIPAGALLRYTLNGGEPNELSPAYYAQTGIAVNSSSVLRVKGFLNGWIPSETSTATYTITGQVNFNASVFTPPAGSYTTAQSVIIGGTTPTNAVRRYTTDGTEPQITSPIFDNANPIAIPLGAVTTVKVKAFLDDWTPSITETAVYNITGQVVMTDPIFNPSPDMYTTPIAVSINTVTMPINATIRYTTDGSDPNATSPEYTVPIQVLANQSVTIRTRAFMNGWLPSAISTGVYNVTGQVLITGTVFTPDPNVIYTTAQNVVISTETNTLGAVIRYTTDGNEPGETSPIYSQAIALGLNTVTEIKVKAFKTGWTSSPTYSATYIITGQVSIDDVTILPASGTYQTAQTISSTGSLVPNDAVLRYTTDGSAPTEASPLFTSLTPPLVSSLDLRVRGFKPNWIPSTIIRMSYTFTGQVVLSTPMFTPAAGTYSSATSVALNEVTVPAGATLRYTLNGIDPSESSPAYSTAILLPMNTTTTLKVRGFLANWTPSVVMSAQYVLTGALDIAAPQFTPVSGLYYATQNVSLGNSIIMGTATTATGATIRYTTDGSEPIATSTAYSPATPIIINSTTMLKIKSFKADWISSPTYTANYTITGQVSIAGVSVTPNAGTYQTVQTIGSTGSLVPSDAVLRYTTDGSEPTESSPVFSTLEPPLDSVLNLKLRGFKTDWLPSPVLSASYTFTGQVQITGTVFTPNPAVIYTSAQNVVISTATNPVGTTIRYTTDGSEPSETSSLYTQPIPLDLNSVTTIKAKSYKANWTTSETYTAVYTITGKVVFSGVLFNLEPNTYATAQNVQITAAVDPLPATIYYTIDGTNPTETSDIYTQGLDIPLPLNSQTTVKARAFNPNWIDSDIISATYLITGQVLLSASSFNPPEGTYTTQQSIIVAPAQLPTDGVTIRYTLDGTDPTVNSPAYVNPIQLPMAAITEIRLKGFATGWVASDVVSGVYNITGTVATPGFSHPGDITYGASFKLGISCATLGAVIRYTDDGSDVTPTSPVYADSISIVATSQHWTIKAKAYKTDWVDSAQNAANYTLLLSPINVWTENHNTHIRILWNLPMARALDGFNVYRKKSTDIAFPGTPLNSAPVNDMLGVDYYYDDYAIENNIVYQYMVKAIYDGVESPPSNIDDGQLISPNLVISETSIAYPNPAVTSSTIRVVLSRNDNVQVSVEIYDFAGKKLRTLSVPSTSTNKVEIVWDLKNSSGTKVARGTYFARVVVGDSTTKQEKVIKIAVK